MAEEWRVSLVTGGGGSTVKGSRYRDLLRARLGDDVAVSAGKTHLFLYAGSAKAADEAGQVARAVLEEHGQFAEVRLERWDPSDGEWRDPDEPAAHEDRPERAVLEEHGQFAEVRVERWDPSGGEWRDPGEPAEHEDRPEPGRLQTTAIAFVKGAGQALARGDLA